MKGCQQYGEVEVIYGINEKGFRFLGVRHRRSRCDKEKLITHSTVVVKMKLRKCLCRRLKFLHVSKTTREKCGKYVSFYKNNLQLDECEDCVQSGNAG